MESYEDNQVFSWRDLAIRYNVCNKAGGVAKNGGQIVNVKDISFLWFSKLVTILEIVDFGLDKLDSDWLP